MTEVFDPRPLWVRAAEAFSLSQQKTRTPDEQRKLDAWHIRSALDVLGDLHARRRPSPPERPLAFPANDEALRDALRRARSAPRPSQEERQLLSEHGGWMQLRWKTEHEGSARVQEVIAALRSIEGVLVRHPGDSVMLDGRSALVDFLRDEWGVHITDRAPGYFEARDLADRSARLLAPRGEANNGSPRDTGREEW